MSTERKTSRKLLLSAALLAGAAGIAGLGTYGTFTSTTSALATVGTGSVKIELGPQVGATYELNASGQLAVRDMLPGDSIQRVATLNNTGDQPLSGIAVTTKATTSSLLDSDSTNGLKLTIDSCPNPWTETKTALGYTYACVGATTKSLLSSSAIIQSGAQLQDGMAALQKGKTDNLRFTVTLPQDAGNTFQNLTSVVEFRFDGMSRAGTNR